MHWIVRIAFVVTHFIFTCKLGSAVTVTHSLHYYAMATPTGSGLPQFSDVGILDGVPFFQYTSSTGRAVALSPWFSSVLKSSERDRLLWCFQDAERVLTRALKEAMNRFNHTETHFYQGAQGCEQRSDGSFWTFLRHGYDGSDFIAYDHTTKTWTAAQPQAFAYKMLREADLDYQPMLDSYYGFECMFDLNSYLKLAGNILNKTVEPEVALIEDHSGTEVTCHVTGFYPPEVQVEWLGMGGRPLVEGVSSGEVLPNEDGTYQLRKRLTLLGGPQDTQSYSCLVLHSSRPTNITVTWVPKKNGTGWIFAVVALVVIAGILTAIAVAIWKGVLPATICWTRRAEAGRPGRCEVQQPVAPADRVAREEDDDHNQEGGSVRSSFLSNITHDSQ